MQSTSQLNVDNHLGNKEVGADAFSNNEVNKQVIEQVKIGSKEICIREESVEGEDGVLFSRWVM